MTAFVYENSLWHFQGLEFSVNDVSADFLKVDFCRVKTLLLKILGKKTQESHKIVVKSCKKM